MRYSLRALRIVVGFLAAAGVSQTYCQVAAQSASPPADAHVRAVVNSGNDFAFDLYGKLRKESDGNLFFSPQSVATALTMTYAGAKGETATQMASVLHHDLPPEKLHPAAAALLSDLNSLGQSNVQLSVVNRLWLQEGYKFSATFLDQLRTGYQAGAVKVDFAQPDAARQVINAWAKKATAGEIDDLIPPDSLNSLTRLVLANVVYFKGDWERAFPEAGTKPSQFYASKTTTIDDVPMMHQEGYFRFGQFKFSGDQGLKLLELPYKGQRLSMVLLLPEAVDGLTDLEQNLTVDHLPQWLESAEWQEVMVWLPKFKVSDQFQLKDVLATMGMKSAFLPEAADFSGIDGSKDLYLSAVIHKAFVEVNEQGTEAAGATVTGPPIPAPVSPEFRADHPFLFLIRDRTTGAILFMGRVADPL